MPITIGGGLPFCGRELSAIEWDLIQQVTREFPALALTELSRTICELLEWKRPNGGLKSRECYLWLLNLRSRGWLPGLPAPRPIRRSPHITKLNEQSEPASAISGPLGDWLPVELQRIEETGGRQLFEQYIQRYHYLGYRVPYGAQIRYFVRSARPPQPVLACLLFTSAAWKIAPRDRLIGWSEALRPHNLCRVVNNARFLILPWVRIPHLASHILSRAARQLRPDWRERYGVDPVLLETLVDRELYAGTCYRAANWSSAGWTQGRGRMDRSGKAQGSCKEIFLYPLARRWQEQLCAPPAKLSPAVSTPPPGRIRLNLLETLDQLLQSWRDVFPQQRTFLRARRLLMGLLVSVRMHLTSNAICATGRQFVDGSADYRVCSRSQWDPHRLFDPVFDHLPSLLASPEAPVLMALDDTLCRKSSPRIPGTSMGRDPMSPPFRVNLCYGQRFVPASLLVMPTQQPGPARALPVRFEFAPPATKPRPPRKKAVETGAPKTAAQDNPSNAAPAAPEQPLTVEDLEKQQQWNASMEVYKKEKKLRRLPLVGVSVIRSVRDDLNKRPETRNRILIASGDGSYTTRDVVRNQPEKTVYIGRIRKDAKLCFPVEVAADKPVGRPRHYGAPAPTPEQILRDNSYEVVMVKCFAAGKSHDIPVKTLRPVYWRNAGCDLPLQVVVIKPLAYRLRKGSRLLYRKPAFLICTDPTLSLQQLVQAYVYRWEIECNHRDEKSLLGVAQGQVWNPDAVRRLPQLQVAGYSLLLLASLLSTGFERTDDFLPLPKWRRKSTRPSLLDLLILLRNQIFARGVDQPLLDLDALAADAVPPRLKSSKLPLAAETLTTLAA